MINTVTPNYLDPKMIEDQTRMVMCYQNACYTFNMNKTTGILASVEDANTGNGDKRPTYES